MMRVVTISWIALLCAFNLCAQEYDIFTKTIQQLYKGGTIAADTWKFLNNRQQIPFTTHDSVAFLYQGEATSVQWIGDFNGWGYDKKFNTKGTRIPGTNLWILKASFPADARLDYKIVINDSQWILDPANQYQQWSGVGGGSPNSELRMPQWKADPITQPLPAIFHGRLLQDQLLTSNVLGYQTMYSVYLPPNYQPAGKDVFPVLYVLDGYEYLHERMGNMTTILDNLIHLKNIKPVIVIFIDHREPINRANNRRMQELAMNENYLHFLTDELLPAIEKTYPISTQPQDRAILGTSMGGLSAAYVAFSKPEFFGLAGIQSPAFWFRPEIYTVCNDAEKPPVKVFMSTGTVHDAQEGASKMRDILEKNTCTYRYEEVHQGHSWGSWRDQLDDILIYFFGL